MEQLLSDSSTAPIPPTKLIGMLSERGQLLAIVNTLHC